MNDNAKRFVAALRSGTYQQARGSLRRSHPNGYAYCCLGVACMEYGKATGALVSLSGITLTPEVRDWLGFTTEGGHYYHENGVDASLVEDNDARNKTFAEIADIIESEPKGLFHDTNPERETMGNR